MVPRGTVITVTNCQWRFILNPRMKLQSSGLKLLIQEGQRYHYRAMHSWQHTATLSLCRLIHDCRFLTSVSWMCELKLYMCTACEQVLVQYWSALASRHVSSCPTHRWQSLTHSSHKDYAEWELKDKRGTQLWLHLFHLTWKDFRISLQLWVDVSATHRWRCLAPWPLFESLISHCPRVECRWTMMSL